MRGAGWRLALAGVVLGLVLAGGDSCTRDGRLGSAPTAPTAPTAPVAGVAASA